ncbi:hypothetical protein [Mesorhizobium sp. WSM4313]|uniref:hypothetical protein n=1 Tax=Mesorhizobium sp. WSM4313 TaxID=2029412 RepID=UPI000BAEDD7A|nr:hypothetical protein [Mesorhizobium sp. WSM4313]PBB21651.1 hypothetical protein CK219_03500 [Mesorhizobium sp. WSM4313]
MEGLDAEPMTLSRDLCNIGGMRNCDLTERPGKGFTPWKKGTGEADVDKVWCAARCLHFPKLNVSCWFDSSELVGIEHWGRRGDKWTMKNKPSDCSRA